MRKTLTYMSRRVTCESEGLRKGNVRLAASERAKGWRPGCPMLEFAYPAEMRMNCSGPRGLQLPVV